MRTAEIVKAIIYAMPWALLICTGIAWLAREKIKQMLLRVVNKELAEHGAKLSRELEAYKVTLIADAEKAKSWAEIRKSVALKIAEKKYNAIIELYDAHLGFDTQVSSHLTLARNPLVAENIFADAYTREHGVLLDRMSKYGEAYGRARPHLSIDTMAAILHIRSLVGQRLEQRMRHSDPALLHDSQEILELLEQGTKIDHMLKNLIDEMEKLS